MNIGLKGSAWLWNNGVKALETAYRKNMVKWSKHVIQVGATFLNRSLQQNLVQIHDFRSFTGQAEVLDEVYLTIKPPQSVHWWPKHLPQPTLQTTFAPHIRVIIKCPYRSLLMLIHTYLFFLSCFHSTFQKSFQISNSAHEDAGLWDALACSHRRSHLRFVWQSTQGGAPAVMVMGGDERAPAKYTQSSKQSPCLDVFRTLKCGKKATNNPGVISTKQGL